MRYQLLFLFTLIFNLNLIAGQAEYDEAYQDCKDGKEQQQEQADMFMMMSLMNPVTAVITLPMSLMMKMQAEHSGDCERSGSEGYASTTDSSTSSGSSTQTYSASGGSSYSSGSSNSYGGGGSYSSYSQPRGAGIPSDQLVSLR